MGKNSLHIPMLYERQLQSVVKIMVIKEAKLLGKVVFVATYMSQVLVQGNVGGVRKQNKEPHYWLHYTDIGTCTYFIALSYC